VIEIVKELEVEGMLKDVTVGGIVSEVDGGGGGGGGAGGAGLLAGSPGDVPALISSAFENPSPSESWEPMAVRLWPLVMNAVP